MAKKKEKTYNSKVDRISRVEELSYEMLAKHVATSSNTLIAIPIKQAKEELK